VALAETSGEKPKTEQRSSRRRGFESLEEETQIPQLPIEGSIPDWLSGTLVRVTPAMQEIAGETIRHWFDGLAMLNAFSFSGGVVGYGSRFLRSESYKAARKGRVDYLGLGNDPCRALFKRVSAMWDPDVNDNCNVNVARLGERYLALTELPLPMEFDADTLETKGLVRFDDPVGGNFFSAHPHFDRDGRMVSYVAHLSARSSYRFYSLAPGAGKRELIGKIGGLSKVAYVHSFAITERYLVFVEFPLVVDPVRMVFDPSVRPLIDHFRWRPERGTRFYVIDRATGEQLGTSEGPAHFAFHHVNAFEEEGEIVVDLIVYEDGPRAILRDLDMNWLRGDGEFWHMQPRLHRYRLRPTGGAAVGERLFEERVEMPRINYEAVNERPYQYAYTTGFADSDSDWMDQLFKLDVENRDVKTWREEGCYPGEPVFTPTPGATREDDGVVLSVVLDSRRETSFLLVLDAGTLTEIGRARVPHHIPFGFHGDYFPDRPQREP
jgi:carotenoid cleavage dioxygenase-like enzyme